MGNIAKVESTVSEVEAQIENCIEPYKIERELLESIPGVGKDGATKIIAEVGVDMGQFPDQNHLACMGFVPGATNQPERTKVDASPTGTNICAVFWSNVAGLHPDERILTLVQSTKALQDEEERKKQ